MRATAQLTNPGSILASITVTATLDQWRDLSDDLKDASFHGPGGKLRAAIVDLQLKLSGRLDHEPPSADGEA